MSADTNEYFIDVDVAKEIAKHDLSRFIPLEVTHEAVILATQFLIKDGEEQMATVLKDMAQRHLLRQGPVEGFVAAAISQPDGEKIILSHTYPSYLSTLEMMVSLVWEIGACQAFRRSQSDNEARGQRAIQWFHHHRDARPNPSVIQEAIVKVNKKVKASLVDVLLQDRIITEEQWQDARDKQCGSKKPLHEVLLDMGFVGEEQLANVFAKVFNMPLLTTNEVVVSPECESLLNFEQIRKYSAFPFKITNDVLHVAMSNPRDFGVIEELHLLLNYEIKPVLVSRKTIQERLEKLDVNDERVNALVNQSQADVIGALDAQGGGAKDLISDMEIKEQPIKAITPFPNMPTEYQSLLQTESPTVKLVNLVLSDAIRVRASDIHIEPREQVIEIRYRVDGDLRNILQIPIKFHVKVVARVKILATMDITQNMMPQDGRIQLVVDGRKVDFRVSTIPTFYGEKIVIRILDGAAARTNIHELGFIDSEKQMFIEAIKSPQGMVLVTGPTGSGKTSTLYAALNFVKNESTNIVTIEDPIEFLNEGINQIQVNPARGVTFASGLRSILRQDPNVILIGEIRDKETAEIALKASITGHLLLSTLHTNSCVATITRLADIGIDYFQIASALLLVVSQRLVKTICPDCKTTYEPDEEFKKKYADEIQQFGISVFYRGKGCGKCQYSGYKGRTAVFEVLKLTENMRNIIAKGGFEEEILKEAKKNDFKNLIEVGIDKVKAGITTLDELVRHLGNVEKGDISQVAAPVEAPKDPNRKRRILLIDDEEDIRKIVAKYLQMGGYDVIHAIHGQDGVEKAIKEKPDLIITDLMMPVMDGIEAVKTLRSRLETGIIPIIMLTAKQDKESELAGLSAGADDYISKPFDKDKLLARVNMLLRRGSLNHG